MKKLIKYTVLLVILAGFTISCEDAIDIDQPGRLPAENTFETVQDLQLGLLGIYNFLDLTNEIRFNSLMTDEAARGIENGGQGNALLAFILNSASGEPNAIWVPNYLAISNINRLLDAAELIDAVDDPDTTVNEATQYNNILGQLFAIRAYSHFKLQSYYTTDYTDDSALGVILLDNVAQIGETRPRSTNGEVFGFINEDIDRALNLLTSQNTDRNFVSRDFVLALRARMEAYRGNYSIAKPIAQDLLNRYPLANQTTYTNMFLDRADGEIIFKLARVVNGPFSGQGTGGGGTPGSIFNFVSPDAASGGVFLEMGRKTYNLFEEEDIRRSVNVDASAVINPDYLTDPDFIRSDILPVAKYPGKNGAPLLNDIKIFRSSEMLLLIAEALVTENDLIGAATQIQNLRTARLGSEQDLPVYATATEAWGAILDERRLELIYEGHRWIDLKRLGELGNRAVDRDVRDCENTGACTLPPTDFRFTLPIPIAETSINPEIRAQQNPGY